MGLHGMGALITGGGRGIGAAVAGALAEEGASVVVAARTSAEIEQVAAGLRQAGHTASALPCDVSSVEDVERLVAGARDFLGHIDILVNNAGIASSSPVHSQSLEEWQRIFAVNVTGPFLLTRACLPGMLERGWGRVVNVASVAALGGARYISAYSASKHAVLGFTRCVALEAAARGVTVNAVCPGYVDTELTRSSVERI
ncbi:MAG: SDR family oxidoreductase, partial [Candidatus Eremiobacterota bacterium]